MTHLAIPVRQITNLATMQLPNNNRAYHFYYDRFSEAPFAVPAGFSFIITDAIVDPEVISFSADHFYLVVITVDGCRSLTIRGDGRTMHQALTAGLVVPGPRLTTRDVLTARNTTFSSGPVEVQLLGYFIRGAATATNHAFSP